MAPPRRPIGVVSGRKMWRPRMRAHYASDRTPSLACRSRASRRPTGGAGRHRQLCRRGRRLCRRCRRSRKIRQSARKGFSRIAQALRHRTPDLPVVGIAGIDASNAGAVIAAGADGGVAVISALSLASDPAAAARTPPRHRRRHAGEARHLMTAVAPPRPPPLNKS